MNRHIPNGFNPRRGAAALVPVVIVILIIIAQQRGWLGGGSGSGMTPMPKTSTAPGTRGAGNHSSRPGDEGVQADMSAGADAIETAYRLRRSDMWVEASGVIVRMLADDRDGEPHQKMLLRVDGAPITVMIVHSLEAAERIPAREGDRLRFRGEYEWTEKGGTIHFTHAPQLQRRDPGGWIELNGHRYD